VSEADAPAFSAASREGRWRSAAAETFDLLVVGGGITGAGIARDAAGRGLQVALVEAGDIAAGTSSRSSRLVHGGLRYLETFDFSLVFEALRERQRLLDLAPHLVHPLPFVFPVYRGDPTSLPKLAAGMWLYETLALFRSPRRHRLFRRAGALGAEPMLRSQGLVGGALYFDAQVDDARLTLAVARAAHDAGATLLSYARALAFDLERRSVGAVRVRDELDGREVELRARLVVNATGPWSDRVRQLADSRAAPRLRTTKGVHLLVPRERVGNRNAVIFRSAVDGRVMFILPWREFTYVGTTDTEYSGDPGAAEADGDDVSYLLDSANATFPAAHLTPEDVLSTWSGVRPLLASVKRGRRSPSGTSREHAIWRDPSGLLNVAGGKLTTYRSMAAEVAERAARLLRSEFGIPSGDYYTEHLPLPGAPETSVESLEMELDGSAVNLGMEAGLARDLARRHGTAAGDILALIAADRALGAPVVDGRPYTWAEVIYAVRSELALTLEDVLRRRLQLFYELRDGGLPVARAVAQRIAPEPGLRWDAAEIDRQVEHYAAAVAATRLRPTS
jgi:glycerol-3-phosphate dehydrogenase